MGLKGSSLPRTLLDVAVVSVSDASLWPHALWVCAQAVPLLLCVCAVLWPGFSSLPYALTTALHLHRWARWKLAASATATLLKPSRMRWLRAYLALHVAASYACQRLLLRPPPAWGQAAEVLGLYSVFAPAPAAGGGAVAAAALALQVVHLACVHLLYVAVCGACAASAAVAAEARPLRGVPGLATASVSAVGTGLTSRSPSGLALHQQLLLPAVSAGRWVGRRAGG